MDIDSFDGLLRAARAQTQPQRLLLVFAGAELPADATAEQRAAFEAGVAGELAPLMCVDKDPQALPDFAALLTEAQTLGPRWALVFAGALSGQGGEPPSAPLVDAALQRMVESVRGGDIDRFIPFDRNGDAVRMG